jgi:hypothetical protein
LLPAIRTGYQARCADYIFQLKLTFLLLSFSSPFYKPSYCTVSHGVLSRRGPLGLFLLKYLCSLSLAFSSHEILFLFKKVAHTNSHLSISNRTTSWIQQKNCNNLRLLLCALFTTKTLFYVHHRQCGRWLQFILVLLHKYTDYSWRALPDCTNSLSKCIIQIRNMRPRLIYTYT